MGCVCSAECANRGATDAGSPSIGLAIELPVEEYANDYLDMPLRFRYFFTVDADDLQLLALADDEDEVCARVLAAAGRI